MRDQRRGASRRCYPTKTAALQMVALVAILLLNIIVMIILSVHVSNHL